MEVQRCHNNIINKYLIFEIKLCQRDDPQSHEDNNLTTAT